MIKMTGIYITLIRINFILKIIDEVISSTKTSNVNTNDILDKFPSRRRKSYEELRSMNTICLVKCKFVMLYN